MQVDGPDISPGRDDCQDESSFLSVMNVQIHRTVYATKVQAKFAVSRYVEHFYFCRDGGQ